MTEFTVKRTFKSQLATGFASFVLCFVLACILWPLWSMIMKSFFSALAAPGLAAAEPEMAGQLIGVMVEGSFFWMVINPWIWMTLVMGNYGKTIFTSKQPHAGLWYTVLAWFVGLAAFFVIIGFIGIWWKPFNLALLLTPKTAADVALAVKGWNAANFLALPVIMTQIPFIALFHKWPFAGTSKQPTEGWGVLFFSTLAVVVVWIATIIPSFMPLSIDGQQIVNTPMGSWATWVAFCQAFVFFFLIPAEGGEGYPMKFFAKKQPFMGIAGFLIALAAGFIVPPIVRGIIAPLDLLPGAPLDLAVASLILSGVISMLAWHHLFDDYPSAQLVPNTAARILIRLVIWITLGGVLGTIWLKTFARIPFGASNLGLGYPTMGVLAGQFAFLMTFLLFNTFFDKWPLVYKEPVKVSYKETINNHQI
jgi:hypothetical protein